MYKINQEKYYGNVEYKVELSDINQSKINRYATQLKFRIIEGKGKAIYLIGVKDDGNIVGVENKLIPEYSNIMKTVANQVQSEITDIISIGLPFKDYSIMIIKIKGLFDMKSIFYF